ncbi:reverse transcriptase domain-containing protein [Roseofilum sp. BLCC_M154]|uniref:Reverse transcriptase domain-containing protein n=1 Tax=Roseofilum acuticapitatum BLCC-M154 TaxID=3022444 RepID=A0ABT7APY6_9CYAN|nr:reverse transcriptase domain-containing protein [Roseofilum acuticapitatum]MDJ1168939.1 reverse transcriptase domain-containing protein [Roseofilum acuticapitatum BLCC-M154]
MTIPYSPFPIPYSPFMSITEDFLRPENFRQAWEKVAKKQGSAGVDGETIPKFRRRARANLTQLRESVANSTYQPSPYQQVLIPKGGGESREIGVPTVRDRIVGQALLNVLQPLLDDIFSPASFAYRPNLSYLNAVDKVACWRDLGYTWVLDADIARYFNSIDQQRLLQELRKHIDNSGVLCLIKSLISVGVSTPEGIVNRDRGIPQGAVISPLLANLYLHEFDCRFSASEIRLVRYADDFVILAATRDRIVTTLSEVQQYLAEIGLELHPKKTQITNFNRGFRFLGHGFLENAIFPADPPKEKEEKKSPRPSRNSQKKKRSTRRNQPWKIF